MTNVPIQPQHQPVVTRWQHVLEHLNSERARLDAEVRYVSREIARLEGDVVSLLQHAYGLDTVHARFTLDVDRGVIVTPDNPPADLRVVPTAPGDASDDGAGGA